MTGPLAGIRIIDLSQIVSGPMAATMLADQGAEVIKVESPGGDPVRTLGPAKGDLSAMFIAVNRGKQGLSIDLKSEGGRAILERLIAGADVIIDNFRPGTMDRLGFGYERCRALNPRIIYAAITGFGTEGPYTNIRVYDPVIQAVSGLAATQVDGEGRPSLVRTLIADKVTAVTMAQAITAALFHRERTGEGQRVDVAMIDAAMAFNWPEGMYNHSFVEPEPPFPEYGSMSRLWPCADGQVAIGMMQPVEFIALANAVGLPELAADKRFHGVGGRMKYRDEWAPKLAEAVKSRTKAELMAGFIAEGAVGGRVNTCAEAVDDPQVVHNDVVIAIDHGAAGQVRAARPPARFSATPAVAAGPAPRLGEHGAAVLAGLGYDADAIAGFVASGAVTGL
jgi:crotonobetainyl-CoA:carnitine CoA-transferase CaiB-like acyl-CoA transferase